MKRWRFNSFLDEYIEKDIVLPGAPIISSDFFGLEGAKTGFKPASNNESLMFTATFEEPLLLTPDIYWLSVQIYEDPFSGTDPSGFIWHHGDSPNSINDAAVFISNGDWTYSERGDRNHQAFSISGEFAQVAIPNPAFLYLTAWLILPILKNLKHIHINAWRWIATT